MNRDSLATAMDDIRCRFFGDPLHVRPEIELSDLLDRAVVDALADVFPQGSEAALLATGGYGRGTLHPASDLDLLVLFRQDVHEPVTQTIVNALAETGFEIGCQSKSMSDFDVFRPDESEGIASFFEARYIRGDESLAREFLSKTLPRLVRDNRAAILEALISARVHRHETDQQGIEAAEPNIKTGTGGLRDYHFVRWISWILKTGLPERANEAVVSLYRIRNFLHYLSGRTENVLKLAYQTEISKRLGYTDGDGRTLMSDYRTCAATIERSAKQQERLARRKVAAIPGL